MKELYEFIKEREYIDKLDQPIEDYLRESEHSVAGWKDLVFMSDIDSIHYSDYLYESLLHSYSLEKFLIALQKLVIVYLSDYDPVKKLLQVRVGRDFNKGNKEFISLCNLFNVFIAREEKRTQTLTDLTFEQYKPKEITKEVFQYSYAYHLTNSNVVDKILKYGLQPKSHSKKSYHPERVYLLLPKRGLDLQSMMEQLGADTILKIDLKKLKQYNQQFKFYRDPMSTGDYSVFTENIIYPEVIEKIEG